jgi:hypothetical protein
MITKNKTKRINQDQGTEDITEILFLRLFRRGLLAVQVPRFLKDVLNVIENEGRVSALAVNQRMGRLGWGEESLDERTLELILYLYEGRSHLVPLDAFRTPLDGGEIRVV